MSSRTPSCTRTNNRSADIQIEINIKTIHSSLRKIHGIVNKKSKGKTIIKARIGVFLLI